MRARAFVKLIGASVAAMFAMAPAAMAQVAAPPTGGMTTAPAPAPANVPTPLVPGSEAKVIKSGPQKGLASPPQLAPPQVQAAIWTANQIIGLPYKYGGGHKNFRLAPGYDCSGTVSFALNGAGAALLDTPLDSRSLMKWGETGPGTWFTVYTNRSHAYLMVAGLRLDTSAAGDPGGGKGPRWRPAKRSAKGFKVRHPLNF